MPRFIGIDLAWKSDANPSGAVVLVGDHEGVHLDFVSPPLRTYSEILDFISQFRPSESVIAIDGPLIIPNLVGLRECERMIGRKYGSRYASCHASNLTLYPGAASVRLTEHLETLGYRHPSNTSVELGSMIEVYPHAAFVAFFDLPRIIRYKKGRVAQKVSGLRVLQAILSYLASETPPVLRTPALYQVLSVDPARLRGKERKEYEDSLDALFCAYLACHFWRWGLEQSEIFGDSSTGYIMNPKLRTGYQPPASHCSDPAAYP